MSENVKLRFDASLGKVGLGAEDSKPTDQPQMDDAEAQMRRALGLDGDAPRHRPDTERTESAPRISDRFGGSPQFGGGHLGGAHGGTMHRRRFVQDGDVQVQVVRRDSPDGGVNRPTLAAPTSSRLQRVEAALAAETVAREKAERALADLQATLRDLQTKIGHAELAKNEAVETLRREREAMSTLRQSAAERDQILAEATERAEAAEDEAAEARRALAQERQARTAAERALKDAVNAREEAERLLDAAIAGAEPAAPALPVAAAPVSDLFDAPLPQPRRRGRPPIVRPQPTLESEPEPVKWWLMKPAGKKR